VAIPPVTVNIPPKIPGNSQERIPYRYSQGITPWPKASRCACSRDWKISSGQRIFGKVNAINRRREKAKIKRTAKQILEKVNRRAVLAEIFGIIFDAGDITLSIAMGVLEILNPMS
jgi:hypothetical protein